MTSEATNGKHMRLFVAIELPEAWKHTLADLQDRMKQALAADRRVAGVRLRWVRPEGIHLTLKFIGEVEAERLETIKTQLGLAVTEPPGMTLALWRAGSFTDRRSPRVIWAGVQATPSQSLLPLAESIQTWLAAAGVPRERRGFAPHLTLARLPNDLPDDVRKRVAEVTTAVEAPPVASFRVEHVSLIQSFLGPNGARYERLGEWPP